MPHESQEGFTLIEIVMVLVLLGILSAVAVPKYFDLQEEAIAKKCQHNRGVVQSTLYTRYAAAQLDSMSVNDTWWKTQIDEALKELGDDTCKNGGTCHKLCESDGAYTVTAADVDGTLTVTVACSVHTGGSTPGTGGTKVSMDNAGPLLDWLKDIFTKDITGAVGEGKKDIRSMDDFFTAFGDDGAVDSDATGTDFTVNGDNYGRYTNFSDAVNDALKEAGLVTDSTIWTLTREGKCDGSAGCNYAGTMTLKIAQKPNPMGSGTVETKEYTLSYRYGPNTWVNGKKIPGKLESIEVVGSGLSGTGNISTKSDKGNPPKDYWVLR